MAAWWRRRSQQALEGGPPAPRVKSYSSDAGYVYRYFYAGHRPASAPEAAMEHVFQVSPGTGDFAAVSVFLGDNAVAEFERSHHRELNPTERYALVKLALFQVFDECEDPASLSRAIRVRPEDLGPFAETLGLV